MKKLLAVLLVLILAPLGASAFFFSPGGSSGGSTSASDLSSGTIPAARIGDNSITSTKLLDNTILTGKIGNGTIVNEDISASAAIAASKIDLSAYAVLATPTFTGVPAAPTAAADTNTTQIATTAFVIGQGYAKLVSPSFTTPTLGVASATTLNTGQGAYELYAMDQNVRTTDNVTFGTVTATEFVSSAADNTRGWTAMNSAAPTTTNLAAGKCWYLAGATSAADLVQCRNSDNTATNNVGAVVKTFSFAIDNVTSAAADNVLLTRVPRAWTITRWDCSASVDNVVGNFLECATDNVISCGVVDAATVGGGTRTDAPTSDTSITDGAIAAGAWLRWSTTSVGTAATNKLSCTIQYRE